MAAPWPGQTASSGWPRRRRTCALQLLQRWQLSAAARHRAGPRQRALLLPDIPVSPQRPYRLTPGSHLSGLHLSCLPTSPQQQPESLLSALASPSHHFPSLLPSTAGLCTQAGLCTLCHVLQHVSGRLLIPPCPPPFKQAALSCSGQACARDACWFPVLTGPWRLPAEWRLHHLQPSPLPMRAPPCNNALRRSLMVLCSVSHGAACCSSPNIPHLLPLFSRPLDESLPSADFFFPALLAISLRVSLSNAPCSETLAGVVKQGRSMGQIWPGAPPGERQAPRARAHAAQVLTAVSQHEPLAQRHRHSCAHHTLNSASSFDGSHELRPLAAAVATA